MKMHHCAPGEEKKMMIASSAHAGLGSSWKQAFTLDHLLFSCSIRVDSRPEIPGYYLIVFYRSFSKN